MGRISGKLTVSSNMAFTSEVSEKGMTIDKGESICLKRSALVEGRVLPQEANVEQMEKNGGELLEFMMNSKIKVKLGQLLIFFP